MKCPQGLVWIPYPGYCSRCRPGYVWDAEWHECVKMDRTVIEPGKYHITSASFFGWDGGKLSPKSLFLTALVILFVSKLLNE